MGIKLKKIDRVQTSLKQLIDVDSSTGITRCVDCISNGMVLVASVPRDVSKKDTFVFKNLTDIIKVGQGMQATLVNGIMTISTSLESLNLNDLLDVSINNPADDDVLTYNSVLQRWENTAGGWVPTTRLITINGVTQDLSADRTWTISTGGGSGTVTSVSGTGTVSGLTLSGSVTTSGSLTLGGTLVLTSGNITSGLGYTPYDASNPSNYITSSALSAYLTIASASSTYLTQANASSTYLTIANAASSYQPIFTTQNGLTYSGGFLELGGGLLVDTTIDGVGSGTWKLDFTNLHSSTNNARYSYSFATAHGGNNTLLSLDSGNNISTFSHEDSLSGDISAIELLGTELRIKTPDYATATNGDVLTLLDNTTGEAEWQTPATGGGGLLFGTASGTDTYTVTISGATAYTDGDAYIIRFTNGNTTGATLNISSFGAKTLYRNNDGPLLGGDILDGAEMLVIYNSALDAFDCIGISPNSLFSYVTNDDTVSITKGQPVYASGGTGDRLKVKLAYNTTDATSAQTIGLVYSASIASGQKGIIMMQGLLDGLNILPTATWSDGDPVYLGATAGAITKTKPSAPNHLVYLGFVTSASNGSSGRLYVKVQNGYELDEIHNVDLVSTAPVNNDVLVFDTSTTPDLWKPKSIPTILGITTVGNNLITIPNPGAVRYLRVNADNTVSALSLSDLKTDLGLGTIAIKSNNQSSNITTYADVTDLSFSVVSGKKYRFKIVALYDATNTSTGSRWSINSSVTFSQLLYYVEWSLSSAGASTRKGYTTYDEETTANSTSGFTSGNVAVIEGIITPTSSGTINARFACELTITSITCKAGSYVEWEEVL